MHTCMQILTLAVTLLSVSVLLAQTQTPPGLFPSSKNHLGVSFNNNVEVVCPGYPLSKADTFNSPRLSLKRMAICSQSAYMTFMIDIDVSFNGSITHLLHWYQPDLILDIETRELVPMCSNSRKALYGGPSPPDGTMHRYVQLLFIQPEDYKLPDCFEKYMEPTISARLFFNITEFMDAAGLDLPIAANYFTVSGGDVMIGESRTFGLDALESYRNEFSIQQAEEGLK